MACLAGAEREEEADGLDGSSFFLLLRGLSRESSTVASDEQKQEKKKKPNIKVKEGRVGVVNKIRL